MKQSTKDRIKAETDWEGLKDVPRKLKNAPRGEKAGYAAGFGTILGAHGASWRLEDTARLSGTSADRLAMAGTLAGLGIIGATAHHYKDLYHVGPKNAHAPRATALYYYRTQHGRRQRVHKGRQASAHMYRSMQP